MKTYPLCRGGLEMVATTPVECSTLLEHAGKPFLDCRHVEACRDYGVAYGTCKYEAIPLVPVLGVSGDWNHAEVEHG